MVRVDSAYAIRGVGLDGDRYATGDGTYSNVPNIGKPSECMRQVTFISEDQISQGNAVLAGMGKREFRAEDTRRNIVVAGPEDISLWVGRTFYFGNIWFEGFELAPPCKIPGRMLGEDGFEIAFKGLGGLRAKILTSGELRVGCCMRGLKPAS